MAKRGSKKSEKKSEVKLKEEKKLEVAKELKQEKKQESYSIANFFSSSKELLFKPGRFLNSIESESRYQPILRVFVLFYMGYFILTLIINLFFTADSINIYQIIQSFLYAIIVSVVFPFLVSGFVYIGVRIFNGKQGFFNIFKPITYSLIILTIYSLIMIIFAVIVPFNNIPADALTSISQEQAMQVWKDYLIQPGAMINLLINLISMIHVFIFSVMGISKFQKITKSKTAFALILSIIIALAVIVLFMIIGYLANPDTSYLANPNSFAGLA